MRALRVFVCCGFVALLASCQTSRTAFVTRSATRTAPLTLAPDSAGTVVLLHDSQGPQATRVVMSASEAAAFRQQ
ncbi:hypothetical protein KLP40_02380 [Hymenobacter sp. NST-14]|uniref:hypothetical protein n=1 Tax=Hymenobacter piscis TaxID=2839984 RepID=UPI001C02E4F7|nr:hypothetical protein [Hymenobacter piscis]MBT9391999.1 hypothetical protein [Hymenobacter piscis]